MSAMSYHPAVAPNPRRTPAWAWLLIGFLVLALIAGAAAAAVYLAKRLAGGTRSGDVAYTLHLTAPDGGRPSGDAVEQTRTILLNRLRQLDITRPTVTTTGADALRVTAAFYDADRARAVLAPGDLTFRTVLAQTQAAAGADCAADVSAPADPAGALASAKAKVGDATYQAAAALSGPDDPKAAGLTGFDKLTCAEVAALPPAMQYAVPGVGCTALGHRPPGALAATAAVVACGQGMKYRLDVAKVAGADLAGAESQMRKDLGTWVVLLHFTAAGQQRWTDLTREALNGQVAILVDNEVVSAPTIQSVITGDAEISGGELSTRDSSSALAATLGHGGMPTRISVTATETVR